MKKSLSRHFLFIITITFFLFLLLGIKESVFAKVESKILKNIPLDEAPRDITVSSDGAVAYILCDKNILIYSTQENKVVDTIPLTGEFSQIALSPDGEKLFLTDTKKKQLSIIQVSQVYDIEVGQSPIIGKAGAPVTVFAFLDYQ
jgi:WD40 repeat protein